MEILKGYNIPEKPHTRDISEETTDLEKKKPFMVDGVSNFVR